MSEIYYESIRTLTDRLARRDLSVAELRAELLARIDALDSRYRAVVATFPGAPESDAYPENAMPESHLTGIPILLKDNIAITGPWPTTAGSRAMADATVRRDASIAAQIRASGMDVLGKTNLSEWANFRSSFSSSGWSSVGGQTVNAFDPSRTPGGSSSGSAVAVALGYAPAAIGTETDGSIVGPSAMNGVVGFKPTVGLVSRHGIIPISSSQDTAGPIARSVEDAAAVLETLCASDANDAATLDRP
ncbi:MAG: amidase family protein, partial [Gammaproteobacteria bacterium]